MRLKRFLAAMAVLFAGMSLLPSAALAQARQCLVTATSPPAVTTYDPFNPTGISVSNVQITFTRANGPGGAKPATIDFYLDANSSGANGIQLIPTSAAGNGSGTGYGQDIFYGTNETPPNITVPLGNTPIPGVFRWDFSGNNPDSDVFTVNFSVVLPSNLDLSASLNLQFDIEYGCNGTGGGPPFSERATAPNAFTLSVRVLSGLQASYVGPALDFGEVGDKTDVEGQALTRTGDIRVASSGPYSVSMVSTNNYRMTYSGGNPATETQNLRYQVTFLGQNRDPTNTAAITRTCVRAGLGSPPLAGGVLLPVAVQLLEGGLDETPSPSYSDTLEVTVSPLVSTTPGNACPI